MGKLAGVALFVFISVVLVGCGKSVEQQEAACELDAWKFVEAHLGGDVKTRAGMTETCMRANGLRFNNDYCRDEDRLPKDAPLAVKLESEPMQEMDPSCYRSS